MLFSFIPYQLEFKHPFGVSSNTRTHTPAVFVKLETEGCSGYGEACLPAYLGETPESTIAFFEKAKPVLERFKDPFDYQEILSAVDALSSHNNAAKAAIDIALFDLAGKLSGQPFYRLMDIPKSPSRSTSCTIGIGSEAETIQKLKEAEAFSFLKIKAGTADDKALIQNIRKHTDKPLYVDVNQGWRDKHKALELLYFFKEQNVVFVEQPLPVHLHEDMAWLTAGSPLPTIADESVKRLADLNQISDCFSGINIKLMKCTGTYEALKMIRYAKQKQLKVMIGCMAESSCATTAMAQLMQSGDYVDLDAPTLLKNDPFKGVTYENGKVVLNDSPGFGMEPLIGF